MSGAASMPKNSRAESLAHFRQELRSSTDIKGGNLSCVKFDGSCDRLDSHPKFFSAVRFSRWS
jgi:hypothetical protein